MRNHSLRGILNRRACCQVYPWWEDYLSLSIRRNSSKDIFQMVTWVNCLTQRDNQSRSAPSHKVWTHHSSKGKLIDRQSSNYLNFLTLSQRRSLISGWLAIWRAWRAWQPWRACRVWRVSLDLCHLQRRAYLGTKRIIPINLLVTLAFRMRTKLQNLTNMRNHCARTRTPKALLVRCMLKTRWLLCPRMLYTTPQRWCLMSLKTALISSNKCSRMEKTFRVLSTHLGRFSTHMSFSPIEFQLTSIFKLKATYTAKSISKVNNHHLYSQLSTNPINRSTWMYLVRTPNKGQMLSTASIKNIIQLRL